MTPWGLLSRSGLSEREDPAAPPHDTPAAGLGPCQGEAAPGSWPRPRLINCCYFKGSETIFLNLSSPKPGAGSKGNVSLIKKGNHRGSFKCSLCLLALSSSSQAVTWKSRASSQPPAQRASRQGNRAVQTSVGENTCEHQEHQVAVRGTGDSRDASSRQLVLATSKPRQHHEESVVPIHH